MFRLCRCHYRQYGVARIRPGFREFFLAAGEILFPPACLGCGAGLDGRREVSYCRACLGDISFLRQPCCTVCGIPFEAAAGDSHLCGTCLVHPWHFTRARAAVRYQPPVSEAIKMFKYGGRMHGVKTLAALSQQWLQEQPLPEPDLLLPVPLHVRRLRRRGFNQALVLCRQIFPAWKGKIAASLLERHVWTRPQTGLQGAARRRNVRNSFLVRRPEKVRDKRILLVDDVFTTGATVNECAKTLAANRAAEVTVFTLARALV
jgi:ComF family protein